jgi:hypothetical protein
MDSAFGQPLDFSQRYWSLKNQSDVEIKTLTGVVNDFSRKTFTFACLSDGQSPSAMFQKRFKNTAKCID